MYNFLNVDDIPFMPDMIWASPPCTSYSIAGISHHRNNQLPKTEFAEKSDFRNYLSQSLACDNSKFKDVYYSTFATSRTKLRPSDEEYINKSEDRFHKLEMRDIEHSLCEFDKYERVRNGEGKPRGRYKWEQ